ncbi:unnamed protein product [Urochloa humidicola]
MLSVGIGRYALVVIGAQTQMLWHIELPGAETAKIQDNGNLVLLDARGRVLWQGFDHPSDTLLPGMSLGLDVATGKNSTLAAWTSPSDPSQSPITLALDSSGVPEAFIWNGSTKIWRSGPWDGGMHFTDIAVDNFSFVDDLDNTQVVAQVRNSSILSRLVLNSSGVSGGGLLQRWTWVEAAGAWNLDWYAPRDQCDTVSRCGVNSVCDTSNPLLCSCLPGFTPQTTAARDGQDGCGRKTPLDCANGTDGFAVVPHANTPDTTSAVVDLGASLEQCRQKCLTNCSCTAYASLNASATTGHRGCIMWTSGLADLRVHPDLGRDLYVRLAAADQGSPSKSTTKKKQIIVATVVSITAVSIPLALAGFLIWIGKRAKARKPGNGQGGDLELPIYDVGTIAVATDGFSITNKLGEGGFGPVYKGKLEDGQEIAVKTLSRKSVQGLDQFKNEVMLIAKLQHRNLVRLIGCSISGEEKMLIYEYMENKSLDCFLFDRTKSMLLDWQTRYRIIEGIARGILYLQQDSRYRIIHRDLKPSNILLDKDMTPKISDFGMARMFGSEETEINTVKVAGTLGHIAPEYANKRVFSMKSDVFSFGVIVLEIITGKKNRDVYMYSDHLNLLEHAWNLWNEGNCLDLVDENLSGSFNSDEVLKCLKMGLLCVQESPEDRPLMSQVLKMLASSDTSSLRAPKQPGFAARRAATEEPLTSKADCTVADSMTTSLIGGR